MYIPSKKRLTTLILLQLIKKLNKNQLNCLLINYVDVY